MPFLIIALLNILVYSQTVFFGVVSDDATMLKTNPYPVRRSKITSILLHTVIAEYIYLAFGQSLIAAILFSIHPMAIQVPVWWSGRYYGLSALIFLMVLAFGWIAVPFYFIAPAGIATVLFTPLLFIFTKHWYIALVFPILAWCSYRGIKANITSKVDGGVPKDLYKWKWINLIIVVKTFGYYSLACLLPIKNGFYNSFLATLGYSNYWYSLNRHFWGGLLAVISMAVIWWFNKFNFTGMGIMLFVLSLIPFLNFITVQQFTTPRYAYLPLIGFQVALVEMIFKLPIIPQSAILGALFLFYLDRTVRVMKHYKKDNITMIELDSQVFPDNPRLWYFRYEHMLHKNNPIMAWAEATYGLKYLPEDCQLWFGLACASFELGDMNAASEFLRTSEKFMMLTEREDMRGLITEMRQRIDIALKQKWQPKRRF